MGGPGEAPNNHTQQLFCELKDPLLNKKDINKKLVRCNPLKMSKIQDGRHVTNLKIAIN